MSGSRTAETARYLTLGRIVSVHGVRGWLKVSAFTDPPEGLLAYRRWHGVDEAGRERELTLLDGDAYRGQLRVQLEGINDRDQALALVGYWVQVEREALPKPAEREHFREDLVGLAVVNTQGATLGSLSHFVDMPAGAVMVVRGAREHWIPASPPHLVRVEAAAGRVVVDWPEEL